MTTAFAILAMLSVLAIPLLAFYSIAERILEWWSSSVPILPGPYRHRWTGERVVVTAVIADAEGTRQVYYLRPYLMWDLHFPENKFRQVYKPE